MYSASNVLKLFFQNYSSVNVDFQILVLHYFSRKNGYFLKINTKLSSFPILDKLSIYFYIYVNGFVVAYIPMRKRTSVKRHRNQRLSKAIGAICKWDDSSTA